MKTLIALLPYYFGINLFFSGLFLGKGQEWATSRAEKITLYLTALFNIFFGVIYMVVYFVGYTIWILIIKKIILFFGLGILFNLYFTKTYNNLTKEDLEFKNNIVKEKCTTNSIKHRVFRYCNDLINKRNNYTPEVNNITEPKTEQHPFNEVGFEDGETVNR